MPGITVFPARSTLVAPAGIWIEAPAAVMRPLLMTTVPRSIGGRPVPSMMRTPVSAVTAAPCAADRSDARLPVSTRAARRPTTICVEARNVIRMLPSCRRIPLSEHASFPLDSAQAKVLDFEELLDPVLRPLAAEAGFLDAAERRHLGGDHPGIDADHARLERFGDAPHAADVASVEIRSEAEGRVVGEGNHFVFGLETEERRHGTERFLAGNQHGGRHVHEHSRLEETAAERVAPAPDDHVRALGERVADVLFHFLDGAVVDQRSLGGA